MPSTSVLSVRRVSVESTGVLVTFKYTYLKKGMGSGVTAKGERTLSRIAMLTNGCDVVQRSPLTIELVGQQGNRRVNSLMALNAALHGSAVSGADVAAAAAVPVQGRRELKCVGWTLWAVWRTSSSRVTRVDAVPAGATLVVDVSLIVAGGFSQQDRESLAEVSRSLPQGELVQPPEGESVYVRYASNVKNDVRLANEIGELTELLAKLF